MHASGQEHRHMGQIDNLVYSAGMTDSRALAVRTSKYTLRRSKYIPQSSEVHEMSPWAPPEDPPHAVQIRERWTYCLSVLFRRDGKTVATS
mmetsp:Transcript_10641/g.21055  ORF Transcript_10641/g.21055 Transcript_10641/m.21055 type:complete len:91 (-) Transcript_10641:585-857(-)